MLPNSHCAVSLMLNFLSNSVSVVLTPQNRVNLSVDWTKVLKEIRCPGSYGNRLMVEENRKILKGGCIWTSRVIRLVKTTDQLLKYTPASWCSICLEKISSLKKMMYSDCYKKQEKLIVLIWVARSLNWPQWIVEMTSMG